MPYTSVHCTREQNKSVAETKSFSVVRLVKGAVVKKQNTCKHDITHTFDKPRSPSGKSEPDQASMWIPALKHGSYVATAQAAGSDKFSNCHPFTALRMYTNRRSVNYDQNLENSVNLFVAVPKAADQRCFWNTSESMNVSLWVSASWIGNCSIFGRVTFAPDCMRSPQSCTQNHCLPHEVETKSHENPRLLQWLFLENKRCFTCMSLGASAPPQGLPWKPGNADNENKKIRTVMTCMILERMEENTMLQ